MHDRLCLLLEREPLKRTLPQLDLLGKSLPQTCAPRRNVTSAHQRQFEAELAEMVTQLASHPSIVQWVVFNEGWGEYAPAGVVDLVQSLDASRLVSPASGWVDDPSGSVREESSVDAFHAAQAEHALRHSY